MTYRQPRLHSGTLAGIENLFMVRNLLLQRHRQGFSSLVSPYPPEKQGSCMSPPPNA